MCDYCGCRSHPEIAALSEDHERVLSLTAAIRRSLEADDDVDEFVEQLAAMLAPHFEREERGVFARMRSTGIGDDYVARFDHEHATLRSLLSAGPSPAQARELVALLEDHILREESDMFPAAHQLFAPNDWVIIDQLAPPE